MLRTTWHLNIRWDVFEAAICNPAMFSWSDQSKFRKIYLFNFQLYSKKQFCGGGYFFSQNKNPEKLIPSEYSHVLLVKCQLLNLKNFPWVPPLSEPWNARLQHKCSKVAAALVKLTPRFLTLANIDSDVVHPCHQQS